MLEQRLQLRLENMFQCIYYHGRTGRTSLSILLYTERIINRFISYAHNFKNRKTLKYSDGPNLARSPQSEQYHPPKWQTEIDDLARCPPHTHTHIHAHTHTHTHQPHLLGNTLSLGQMDNHTDRPPRDPWSGLDPLPHPSLDTSISLAAPTDTEDHPRADSSENGMLASRRPAFSESRTEVS